ncbi:thermonuclease family protein [Adhaeretor mobilis]|uniref:Thermonuclease n=1 Tax=Adhaeretor mobilis TaxID=1930276 RepID=A0A517MVZ4_9BACT|nr:thermonuclease family protein [Adhaeretor mobilis]QDS99055.1 Thermonuclease precursor [Adhaeretor mobilis]
MLIFVVVVFLLSVLTGKKDPSNSQPTQQQVSTHQPVPEQVADPSPKVVEKPTIKLPPVTIKTTTSTTTNNVVIETVPEPDPSYRTWSSRNGKFTTLARLLDFNDESALLLKHEPQKLLTIPLSYLSEADANYLKANTQEVVEGKVIGFADGDTVTLYQEDRTIHKIRLQGIDTPEKGQDYATQASKALKKMLLRQNVRVRWVKKDNYGRILGNIFTEDAWVNLAMIRDGWAWHYTEYSDDLDLVQAERDAREAKRGLWADPNKPVSPWDHRARQKHLQAQRRIEATRRETTNSTTYRAPVMRYWLNTSTNARHNSTRKHFNNTKEGRMSTGSEGKACGICGG